MSHKKKLGAHIAFQENNSSQQTQSNLANGWADERERQRKSERTNERTNKRTQHNEVTNKKTEIGPTNEKKCRDECGHQQILIFSFRFTLCQFRGKSVSVSPLMQQNGYTRKCHQHSLCSFAKEAIFNIKRLIMWLCISLCFTLCCLHFLQQAGQALVSALHSTCIFLPLDFHLTLGFRFHLHFHFHLILSNFTTHAFMRRSGLQST